MFAKYTARFLSNVELEYPSRDKIFCLLHLSINSLEMDIPLNTSKLPWIKYLCSLFLWALSIILVRSTAKGPRVKMELVSLSLDISLSLRYKNDSIEYINSAALTSLEFGSPVIGTLSRFFMPAIFMKVYQMILICLFS